MREGAPQKLLTELTSAAVTKVKRSKRAII